MSIHRPGIRRPLSAREIEVLDLIAQGMSGAEIAEELNISDHTVRTHKLRIYDALGLPTRAGTHQSAVLAVAIGYELGVIGPLAPIRKAVVGLWAVHRRMHQNMSMAGQGAARCPTCDKLRHVVVLAGGNHDEEEDALDSVRRIS